MSIKLFPRALAACFLLSLSATSALAQTEFTRPRQVSANTQPDGASRLETDPVIISLAPVDDVVPSAAPFGSKPSSLAPLDQMLLAAIEVRLGTPYRLGTEGPYRFDCSGFVWSVFQSAGIEFERTNARSLWARFAPAREDEKFKFGTLVFFNNLGHVGIVAGDGGFYHASTSKGVVHSPFNEYWTSRIDGFRRVPIAREMLAANR